MSLLSRKLINENKVPKSRVELHLHLEGAVRLSTVWELSYKKGIKLTPNGTLDELQEEYLFKKPGTLVHCLDLLLRCGQVYHGDAEAIERIAYEISEDEARDGILYFEVRMSPQLNANTVKRNDDLLAQVLSSDDPNACSPKRVVESVLKGLKRGENDFGVKSSLILCCMCGYPEWSEEVLELVQEFRDKGVVGIDIAGPESMSPTAGHSYSPKEVLIFQKAKELNIHRTCHAGEDGPAANVAFAVDNMCAERVGHGYRALNDESVYQKCLSADIHFECCPYSSYFTGAVNPADKHPIVRLAEDNANFSVSKDDPTVFGSTLDDEYECLRRMGLNELHLTRANINAIKSSFLPENEKKGLLKQLLSVYGLN